MRRNSLPDNSRQPLVNSGSSLNIERELETERKRGQLTANRERTLQVDSVLGKLAARSLFILIEPSLCMLKVLFSCRRETKVLMNLWLSRMQQPELMIPFLVGWRLIFYKYFFLPRQLLLRWLLNFRSDNATTRTLFLLNLYDILIIEDQETGSISQIYWIVYWSIKLIVMGHFGSTCIFLSVAVHSREIQNCDAWSHRCLFFIDW